MAEEPRFVLRKYQEAKRPKADILDTHTAPRRQIIWAVSNSYKAAIQKMVDDLKEALAIAEAGLEGL